MIGVLEPLSRRAPRSSVPSPPSVIRQSSLPSASLRVGGGAGQNARTRSSL